MTRRGGWRRRGRRKPFRYVDHRGNPITDPEHVERVEALAIPPAWREVWISPRPRAKVQATGIDAAGRRQYLYHEDFRAAQEQAKFDKLVGFAERLPELRRAMAEHMDLERHARVRGERITFSFRGKGRSRVRAVVVDEELAEAVRNLLALDGGRRLFRYRWKGDLCNLTGARLNEYIAEHMGEDFTAKDFRTWGGTLIAAIALAENGVAETETEAKRAVTAVMQRVGERLGNTPAVARSSYVSPAIVEQYLEGRTIEDFRPRHLRVVSAR